MVGGGGVVPKLIILVILKMYTKFQPSIMPGSGQINFPGREGAGWLVGGWIN